MEYNILDCSQISYTPLYFFVTFNFVLLRCLFNLQILLPFCFFGHLSLYVFNMNTRSIYIMDYMPLPSLFKANDPSMHYIHKIHSTTNNMNAAMKLINPTWKDDIYMWRRIVPSWVPKILN
jgi:hypothetical protein